MKINQRRLVVEALEARLVLSGLGQPSDAGPERASHRDSTR